MEKLTGEILADRLIIDAFFENRKAGKINLLTAGTGVGKTHNTMWKLIPRLIEEGTTKFLITTPLKDSAVSSKKVFKRMRKKIERRLDKKLNSDIVIEFAETVDEFINSFSDENKIMILVANTDSILNSPTKKKSNRELIVEFSAKYLSLNKLAVIADEIHYGGSTESATTQINNGVKAVHKAALIKFLISLSKNSWIVGISATLINEQEGNLFGILKHLLNNPDVYHICTREEDAPTHEELTRILSNYHTTKWITEDNVVETAVEIFEAKRTTIVSKSEYLSSEFPELEFNSNVIMMLTCAYGTYRGEPTTAKGYNVPIHESIPKVSRITSNLGQDSKAYYMLETTKSGVKLWNNDGEFVEVESHRVEGILNGTDLEYSGVRYLFVVEKYKMSMNVPSIILYASARERKGTKMSGKYLAEDGNTATITVTIRQLFGRTVRPFFGLKLNNEIFPEGVYSPEQVAKILYSRYSNHSKFKDLMEYVRMCNSHTFVLPDELQFRNAVETWESSYAAGIDKSLFLTDEALPKEFTYTTIVEDGEQCPTCGKFGYLGDPSEMNLDFNDIANSTTIN